MLPWLIPVLALPALVVFTVLAFQSRSWLPFVPLGLCVVAVPLVIVHPLIGFAGWDKLARAFPATPQQLADANWHENLTTIALKRPWMSLNNCIIWSSNDDRLLLAIAPPFNYFFPARAICIPWNQLDSLKPLSRTGDSFEIVTTASRPLPVSLFVMRDIVIPCDMLSQTSTASA